MSTISVTDFRTIMPREAPTGDLPVPNIRFARIAELGTVKLLRTFANARFGEAAPRRRDPRPRSAKGLFC
ncbi:hypothetical protein [Sulfitobacter sp.]|uniref:hypothetical protein n=1 Tax=Sulfitobacter sp. TaxID=1903071 RepID=UPI003001F0AA